MRAGSRQRADREQTAEQTAEQTGEQTNPPVEVAAHIDADSSSLLS